MKRYEKSPALSVERVSVTSSFVSAERANVSQVLLAWSGIPNPQPSDWLGMYCPPSTTSRNDLFTLWWPVTYAQQTWQQGFGQLSVNLPMLRTSCEFRYSSEREYVAIASPLVTFNSPRKFEPIQAHIALTSDPSEMRINWNTEAFYTATAAASPASKRKTGDDHAPQRARIFRDWSVTHLHCQRHVRVDRCRSGIQPRRRFSRRCLDGPAAKHALLLPVWAPQV
jgi:hypothetical protein